MYKDFGEIGSSDVELRKFLHRGRMLEFYLMVLYLSLFSGSNPSYQHEISHKRLSEESGIVNPKQNQLEHRFNPPSGYGRIEADPQSYTAFLRNQALKPYGSDVYLYNGVKKKANVHEAVFTYDHGLTDIQQCADAVMRIRAEYLFAQRKFDQIHFNFTNGFKASYQLWREGWRIAVNEQTTKWIKKTSKDTSYNEFRNYLDKVYTYAGTLSLSKELIPVKNLHNLQAGDVWIKGGSPGHALTVVDVAINRWGRKVFMLAQGYMPAQDIHVLKNEKNKAISPWYKEEDIEQVLETPEYVFYPNNLMRFADN